MTRTLSTEEIAKLHAFSVEDLTVYAPYKFICDNQDDACEIDHAHAEQLMKLMRFVPHVTYTDLSCTGLRVRYASRNESGNYLYVEIDQIEKDRYFVTSFIERDYEYFSAYMLPTPVEAA